MFRQKTMSMMVGLPRSGKSTYIAQNSLLSGFIVSADNLRDLIYGHAYFQNGEPMVWAVRGYMLEEVMRQGLDVTIDETNTTKSARASTLKIAKKYGYKCVAYTFHTSAETCLERTTNEGLRGAIYRMDKQYEPPYLAEGFDEIIEVDGSPQI